MTATVFPQSYMTQRPSLFTLISYCAIVFSFALIFANGLQLVYCMRWLLWCFCLLAESYETINHYHCETKYAVQHKRQIEQVHSWASGQGALVPLDFEIISKKRLFFQFRGAKTEFHHFWTPPGKNFGKIPYCPPWKKILPTPVGALQFTTWKVTNKRDLAKQAPNIRGIL